MALTRTRARTARAALSRNNTGPVSLQQTFFEHIAELRARLLVVAVSAVIGGIAGYIFQDRIAAFLLAPLRGEKLVYLTPGGGLDFVFKICLYTGLLAALPVAVYQVFRYLSPLVKSRQLRRLAAGIIVSSGGLAIAGVLFGYYAIMPSALGFLADFAGKYVQPNLTATGYMDFVALHSLGIAAVFQLPIVLFFINIVNGPIKPVKLLKSEQYVVLGSVVMAALIAPPDLKNQTIVALPIFLVYQLGVVAVLLQNRAKARQAGRYERIVRTVPERPAAGGAGIRPAGQDLRPKPVADIHSQRPVPVATAARPHARPAIAAANRPRPLSMDGVFLPDTTRSL